MKTDFHIYNKNSLKISINKIQQLCKIAVISSFFMKYKELVDLGFERFEMGDGFDSLGFYDFYLFLKVSKEITFEWNWQKKEVVKMVHYKKQDVQNYIEIIDIKTLKNLIYLYKEKEGNDGIKPKIGVDNSEKRSTPIFG